MHRDTLKSVTCCWQGMPSGGGAKRNPTLLVVFLFVTLSVFGAITSGVNEDPELDEEAGNGYTYESDWGAVSSIGESYLNIAGLQEGSVLTDDTLSVGGYVSCAIMEGGSIYCWGGNIAGQLGDGTQTETTTPTPVTMPSGRTAVSVSSGDYHS